jgi:hypothetical protein
MKGLIIGYHGCDAVVAEALIAGEAMRPSEKDYDWLGPGVYFWEDDPRRAQEWADEKARRGVYKAGAVVGAVIDMGNCLDLTLRANLILLTDAYDSLRIAHDAAGLPMPENRDGRDAGDKLLRYLDCAVIKHLHENIEAEAEEARLAGRTPAFAPFDAVRGLFVEGGAVYDGGGFHSLTHTQVAVRNLDRIKGVFRPRGL